jgi:hypothetical protein
MTVRDLEHLESSVGQFGFCQLLADYSRECPDRMRSLHNFIAFSGYADKIKPSERLIEKSTELVTRASHALFGPKPPE